MKVQAGRLTRRQLDAVGLDPVEGGVQWLRQQRRSADIWPAVPPVLACLTFRGAASSGW
jgi:hypothetical protein